MRTKLTEHPVQTITNSSISCLQCIANILINMYKYYIVVARKLLLRLYSKLYTFSYLFCAKSKFNSNQFKSNQINSNRHLNRFIFLPYSNTYIDAQRSGMPLISRTEEVAVYSDRSYKKFEQVSHSSIDIDIC